MKRYLNKIKCFLFGHVYGKWHIAFPLLEKNSWKKCDFLVFCERCGENLVSRPATKQEVCDEWNRCWGTNLQPKDLRPKK